MHETESLLANIASNVVLAYDHSPLNYDCPRWELRRNRGHPEQDTATRIGNHQILLGAIVAVTVIDDVAGRDGGSQFEGQRASHEKIEMPVDLHRLAHQN